MSMAIKPTFTSHSKPSSTIFSFFTNSSLLRYLLVSLLCSASYLLGVFHFRGSNSSSPVPSFSSTSIARSSSSSSTADLDFTLKHSVESYTETTTPTIARFPPCPAEYSEYTPCEDARRSLRFPRDRLVYRERHCPNGSELLRCLVPAPFGYRNPFPWPQSRGVAWFANVPHKELSVEKAVQNWIRVDGDKLWFPGGGTMFPRGADKYIDEIDELLSLRDGAVRTAIDTGCGVASFGAYLMSRDVLTVSFAPRDTHEAQVQFALERGVPALIGVLASMRLPYPSRAFDMAHCSRCLIPWHLHDGQYLAEMDRILRPGGYWVISGPPVNWQTRWRGWNRTEKELNHEQVQIEAVARSLCWEKLKQKGDIAIWQKPINHMGCEAGRKEIQSPPFCSGSNPDEAWYTKLETCITPMPRVDDTGDVAGGAVEKWPARLMAVPPRVKSGSTEGMTAESFAEDVELWKKRVEHYKRVVMELGKPGRYRNMLDMNAKLGGFAATMAQDPIWVMNVVPTITIDTLGVIYERGLIGTYQDWCEAMSTYPRTYDLIHADQVFDLYKDRCEMEYMLLEMDRILRPEGAVIFRDDVDVLVKIKSVTDGMRWDSRIVDHEDGPMEREKILLAVKKYWTLPNPEQ